MGDVSMTRRSHAKHKRRPAKRDRRQRALQILGRAQVATLGILVVLTVVSTTGGTASRPQHVLIAATDACPSGASATAARAGNSGGRGATGADNAVALGSQRQAAQAPAKAAPVRPHPATGLQPAAAARARGRRHTVPAVRPSGAGAGTAGLTAAGKPDAVNAFRLNADPTTAPAPGTGDGGDGGDTGADPTASASSTAPPPPPQPTLCASVVPFGATSVLPGATASFAITVGSTGADASGVTITATLDSSTASSAPVFATCVNAADNVCTIDSVPAGTSQEIVAGSTVGTSTAAGTQITLTAVVASSGATSVQASASVTVAAPASTGTTGSGTGSGTGTATSGSGGSSAAGGSSAGAGASGTTGSGSAVAGASAGLSSPLGVIPSLPSFELPGVSAVIPGMPNGALTTPLDPTSLFPTISPASSGNGTGHRGKSPRKISLDSATLPLGSRLIDGQLAGLVVLLAAIAIAVVRLSLRRRPADASSPADSSIADSAVTPEPEAAAPAT